ncbi:MAG: UxaA family hydrolase [Chloroflexi bacterium]|nr:UxaA family hydrolase [Chloroflexota bacterium]
MARRLVHVINPKDNVATALVDLAPGTRVALDVRDGDKGETALEVRAAVPFGHKIALAAIPKGQPVVKYGEVIGLATVDIAPGDHVHVHNVESQRGRGDLAEGPGGRESG